MSSITHQRVRPARRPAAMATVAAVLLTLGLINPVAAAPPNNPGSSAAGWLAAQVNTDGVIEGYNPGQADYATANAFQDAFAEHRSTLVRNGQRKGRTWPTLCRRESCRNRGLHQSNCWQHAVKVRERSRDRVLKKVLFYCFFLRLSCVPR